MEDKKLADRHRFTAAARAAAAKARAAKRALPERFGAPELFIVRSGGKAFTWELRRFGGMLLKRADVEFADRPAAETAGQEAPDLLIKAGDLPSFERQLTPRLSDI